MALERGIDVPGPFRRERIARTELRPAPSARLAAGTLACPRCDAPVALGTGPASPADPLGCPFCGHAAHVRDFLSLGDPVRPARVDVRVIARG